MDGHYDIVYFLLDNKSEINTKQIDGWTTLMLASMRCHCNVVELLINNKRLMLMINEKCIIW